MQKELPRILSEIDVLIVPSLWLENAPLTIQEALQTGTFVLASRLGGIPERIIPYQNGLLFDPDNIQDLVDCFQQFLTRSEITQASLAPVHSIEEHVQQLEAWYQKVMTQLV